MTRDYSAFSCARAAASVTWAFSARSARASCSGVPPAGSTPTFAAAGYSGVRIVSRDLGRTWVDRQVQGGGGDDPNLLRGIGCGNGLCIAGGGSAGSTGWLSITSDGKTWRRFDLGRPGLSDMAFGNGIWVGVSGHYAVRSADAMTWEIGSDKNALSFGGILRRMTFAGGKFIAWGDGGKRVASADGRAWTRIASGHDWRFVAHGAGIFVAVGGGRQVSTDGITWQGAAGPDGSWIVWTGDTFVMGGNGMVHKSPDGMTWTSMKGNPPGEGVVYGAGTFVAYGWRSTDGVTWTNVNAPSAGITDVDFAYLGP